MPHNPFRSDRGQPRYHRHGGRAAKHPKQPITYEELQYSYDHPSKPRDSRRNRPIVAPSKYDYDGGYPESFGDGMVKDYAPPSRKDSRMDSTEDIIPMGYSSTAPTLNEATFQDQLPLKSKKDAPPPIATLNSLKFSSEPPKNWRKYARRSALHNATRGYREAYDKHRAKKSKDVPKNRRDRPSQGQYLPADDRATLNEATTYEVASDRRDSRDFADAAPPPPPPSHQKSFRPKKTAGIDRSRPQKADDNQSKAPLRRDEISNDPHALKHPRPLKDYDSAPPNKVSPDQLQGFRYEDQPAVPFKSPPNKASNRKKGKQKESDLLLRNFMDQMKDLTHKRDKLRAKLESKRGRPEEEKMVMKALAKVVRKMESLKADRDRGARKPRNDKSNDAYGPERRNSFAKPESPSNVRAAGREVYEEITIDDEPKRGVQATNDISGLREQIIANASALVPFLNTSTSASPSSTFEVIMTTQSLDPYSKNKLTPREATYVAYVAYHKPQGNLQQIGCGDRESSVSGALISLLHITAAAILEYNAEHNNKLLGRVDKAQRWPARAWAATEKRHTAYLDRALIMEGLKGASAEVDAKVESRFVTAGASKRYRNRERNYV